ncbi:MAG: ROK family protein [Mesorhizobium sp.]
MNAVLAIDLGGTKLRAACFMGDVAALATLAEEPAPTSRVGFVERIRRLSQEAGDARALGLAVPGLATGTICHWVPNLPFLDGLDLSKVFPHLSVGLGNDAQLSLLAEAKAGAAMGLTDAVLLAIGTGIGSAVLANGSILAGAHGAACSFGFACADEADEGDPLNGWLERSASGRAFDVLAATIDLADGAALIAAARAGDGAALALLEQPAERLATALAGAVALLDPQAILISGGLAESVDVLGPRIEAALRRRLPPHLQAITVKAGAFGARAGLVGAALAGAAGEDWRQRE